jgi:hypothetical protein
MRRTFLLSAFLLSLASLACCLPATAGPQADPLTPDDAAVLVTLDFQQLLSAPLVKKYALEELKKGLGRAGGAGKLLEAAGIQPFKDVNTLTVGISGDLHKPRILGILRGRFDAEKINTAATAFAKDNPDKLKVEKEGDVPLYRLKGNGGRTLFAAVAGRSALVIAPEKDEVLAAVKAAGETRREVNKKLQSAVGKLSGKDSVWLALVATDAIKDMIGKQDADAEAMAKAMESMTGGLEVTDALKLVLEVHTNNADVASQVRKKIDEALPLLNLFAGGKDTSGRLLKEVLGAIKVGGEKTDARVSLTITEEMIRKAVKPDDNNK